MSLAAWNIRGIGRKNAIAEVKDFCKFCNIKIMMLSEVKSQSPPSLSIINQAGFQFFDYIPTIGYSGGIWLLWKTCNINPFSLNVLFKASRFISAEISLLNSQFKFVAIFIYAPARNDFKSEFWEEIIHYANSISSPFIILGDFNEIGSSQDKEGGLSLIIPDYISCRNFFLKLVV